MRDQPVRRRLGVDERRAQLLQIGCELFATTPYDEVWIEHVAARAGVSRGLLYHYFGSKRGFLHAVVRHETAAIFAATGPDPGKPAAERLTDSLDAYLAYAVAHPHGYRTLFRGAGGADSEVRALVEANLRRQRDRIAAQIAPDGPTPALLRAVSGWLAFTITVTLEWLDEQDLRPAQVRDLCADALAAVVGSLHAAGLC